MPDATMDVVACLRAHIAHLGDVLRLIGGSFSLQNADLQELNDGTIARVVNVKGELPSLLGGGDDVMRRWLEVTTLLDLLWRVDSKAWWNELSTYWSCYRHHEQLEEDVSYLLDEGCEYPWVLGYRFTITKPNDMELLSTHMVASHLTPLRNQKIYIETHERLTKKNKVFPSHSIPITIEVSPSSSCFATPHALLASILQFIVTQKSVNDGVYNVGTSRARTERYVRSFMVTGVNFASHVQMNDAHLHMASLIAHTGVTIGHLANITTGQSSESRKQLAEALLSLIPSRTSTGSIQGVQTLTVDDMWSIHVYPAVLSALQCSRSVTTVVLSVLDANNVYGDRPHRRRRTLMRWLAYALFSLDASHSIHTFEVDPSKLDDKDLQVMAEVIDNPSGLTSLNGLRTAGASSESVIYAKEFFTVTNKRVDGSTLQKLNPITFEEPTFARVLVENIAEKVYKVFVPGFGAARVTSDNILTFQSPAKAKRSSIQKLIITALSNACEDIVVKLLTLIGSNLRSFCVIDSEDYCEVDDLCEQVFELCPKLEDLQLEHCTLSTLAVFNEAATRQSARLRRLFCHVDAEMRSTEVFFQTLCVASHPLTTQLQELHLVLMLYNSDDYKWDDEFWILLRAVIESNRSLWKLTFEFMLAFHDDNVISMIHKMLTPYINHHAYVPNGQPLNKSCQLALLSVIRHRCDSALHQFESAILSIIFALAAPTARRVFNYCVRV